VRQIFLSTQNQYFLQLLNNALVKILSLCILGALLGYFTVNYSLFTFCGLFVFIGLATLFVLVKNKATFVVLLFALAPFTGLIKVFGDFKEFPLIIDFLIVSVIIHTILQKILSTYSLKIKMPQIGWLIIIFLFIAFLEIFNPHQPNLMRGIYGFRVSGAFYMISFFAALLTINSKEDILRIMKVFMITGFIVAIYGIYQYINPSQKEMLYATRGEEWFGWHYMAKPFSTMIGPFHFGLFMVLSSLTVLVSLVKGNVIIRMNKLNLRFIFIFLVIALALSLTRASYLAFIIGTISILFLRTKREKIKLKSINKFVIIMVSVVVLVILVIKVIPHGEMILVRLGMLKDVNDTALWARLWVWPIRINQILQNPLGFGIGINSGENIFQASDNAFLSVGIETGLPGLLIFTVIFLSILKKCFGLLKTLNNPDLQIIALWITSFTIALLSVMMTNHILQAYPLNMFFWFMIGILYKLKFIEAKYCNANTR
jgi:O-antigen ligase